MLYLAILSVGLGLLAGLARGGSLDNLRLLRVRFLWLGALPLAMQYALFAGPLGARLGPASGALHVVTYGLLLVPVALNLATPGMKLIALGILLNAVVIAANGGYMPVSPDALLATGQDDFATVLAQGGTSQKSTLMTSSSRLAFLGDWILLPPVNKVISLGDVAISAGGFFFASGALRLRAEIRAAETPHSDDQAE